MLATFIGFDSVHGCREGRRGGGKTDGLAKGVLEAHTAPGDVGRMAAEAKVKTVVVYHQLMGPRTGALDASVSTFIDGIRAQFNGEVIVGQDLLVL